RRVRESPILAAGAKVLEVEGDDGLGRALCLRVDLLPLWLTGVNSAAVAERLRPRLELFQREAASVLWQSFRPQGFGPEDELVPQRHQQTPAEQAYVGALTQATLARHQMLIERQLDSAARYSDEDPYGAGGGV